MRIVRAADHRRMRWKNGLGETIEFAISPQDATLDTFDWRLSRAAVDQSGPFSVFPGCDRTLCVLDGGSITLEIQGHSRVTLSKNSEPYTFAADIAIQAELIGHSVHDLNLIWRRGTRAPRLYRHGSKLVERVSRPTLTLVFGEAELAGDKSSIRVKENDLVVFEAGELCDLRTNHAAATIYAAVLPP